MQSLTIEFSAEKHLLGGDFYNLFAGVDDEGLPVAIDYAAPLNPAPLPVYPDAVHRGGWASGAHLGYAHLAEPEGVGNRGDHGLRFVRYRPVLAWFTEPLFYFGAYTVAARPVSAAGDEQTGSTPTQSITVNSWPHSPTNVALSSYDNGTDQVVIGLTPPPQLG